MGMLEEKFSHVVTLKDKAILVDGSRHLVHRIDDESFVIGCTRITFDAFKRIAEYLGFKIDKETL